MEFEFIGELYRNGNSLVVTIPIAFLKKAKAKAGTRVRAKVDVVG